MCIAAPLVPLAAGLGGGLLGLGTALAAKGGGSSKNKSSAVTQPMTTTGTVGPSPSGPQMGY